MATEAKEAAPGSITVAQAAQLLEISEPYFYKLQQQGWIKRDPEGRLSLVGVVRGFIAAKNDEIERVRKKASDNEVRQARAREINLRTAKQERELVPAEEAEEFVLLAFGEMISRLTALPARYTRDVRERARLTKHIDEIRGEVAGFLRKLGPAFRSGSELVEAGEEDGAGRMGEEE